MTPNLLVATQTLFSPHKWFKSSSRRGDRPGRKTEHWDSPVPGIYEYIPGRGWYLVATDKFAPVHELDNATALETNNGDDIVSEKQQLASPTTTTKHVETIRMTPPVQVKYSKVLKRYLLSPDYSMRKKHDKIQDPHTGKWHDAGFFRLDDGIAWVECWDDHGEFIPGPYKLWCLDQTTGHFRHMLKGDDPEYVASRTNSFERGNNNSNEQGATAPPQVLHRRRTSLESRTTQYRPSAPSSINNFRDGPSVPSTRANSIRNASGAFTPTTHSQPQSKPGSQAPSRRNSPKRSPTITVPLEEAKAKLRFMAEEQKKMDEEREAARSRANSAESVKRGRTSEKVDY